MLVPSLKRRPVTCCGTIQKSYLELVLLDSSATADFLLKITQIYYHIPPNLSRMFIWKYLQDQVKCNVLTLLPVSCNNICNELVSITDIPTIHVNNVENLSANLSINYLRTYWPTRLINERGGLSQVTSKICKEKCLSYEYTAACNKLRIGLVNLSFG